MTKRLLQQLVLGSYRNGSLNAKTVSEISARLERNNLKAYIRALKLMEQKKKIYIAMPKASVYNISKKKLQEIFPEKEFLFEEDPSLLLGMKVVDDDMIYEMSLKDRLKSVLEEVGQQYGE